MQSLFYSKLILLCTLLLSLPAYSWIQTPSKPLESCSADAPYGFPTGKTGIELCREGYATLNDIDAKIPIWTVYTLTPAESLGCFDRSNGFTSDHSLPEGKRAELSDYTKSGYDRGHIAPSADMVWSENANDESFLLSNIAPQTATLNRGQWKALENFIRTYTIEYNSSVTVYTGPIYNKSSKTIGDNKVVVPEAFYKIIIDNLTNDVLAFILPQENNENLELIERQTTVTDISRQTGITFPMPQGAVLNRYVYEFVLDYKNFQETKNILCN